MFYSKNNQATTSSNQQQQQQSATTKSPKSNKKNEKCKRSTLTKTNSKMSISELIKSNVKENQTRPETFSNHAGPGSANNNNNSNIAGNSNNNSNMRGSSSMKPPTKVKSGSWKRSEKQISSHNAISGIKSKSLRKRSPTWLKFPNSPVKIAEKVSYVGANEATSVCRPGTLYSDVLFGAGSSCLVKIKTLTPRRSTNNAQKKLTKALIKCSRTNNETDAASGSETETDHELFPSLLDGGKSSASPTDADATNTDDCVVTAVAKSDDYDADVDDEDDLVDGVDVDVGAAASAVAIGAVAAIDDGADIVILSETHGVPPHTTNGFSDTLTYGSYLEQHFKPVNGAAHVVERESAAPASAPRSQPFTIDIPQWNFMDADVSSDAYPKFLCQFEDEHYLKAEKMALLGLKLALGNNTNQGKFKF